MDPAAPPVAVDAVFASSEGVELTTPIVKGYDFNHGVDYHAMMKAFATTGFQATNLAAAIAEVKRMRAWRMSDEPEAAHAGMEAAQIGSERCKIFLGYTSNMISSGVREQIRFLVEHKMVDVIVTTAGGIEEDLIKCMASTHIGEFHLDGAGLRKRGINRIGNLLVPNDNYCCFEDWVMPILDAMLEEQKTKGVFWTPSAMIRRLGETINDKSSVYYWAAKNNIPVFCPAITDGSLGDMIYFHSFKNPGLIIDIAADIRNINSEAVFAKKTGMIILGGGIVKHHVCNANLMRNGADFSVYINTAQEFDGSDAGARPDEAVSWGKIRIDAKPVKVYGEASVLFPLLVAETFARELHKLED